MSAVPHLWPKILEAKVFNELVNAKTIFQPGAV